MTAGGPMDRTGADGSAGAGDRSDERLGEDRGGGPSASRSGAPEHEPGPAIINESITGPGPQAPADPAPDMATIEPGDGPGQSPGE